jgi:DNA-binding ferritin-like protein
MRRNPSKLQELETENEALSDTLESINDLANEADDAGLTREQIIEKVREIAELSESDEDEGGAEGGSGE